MIELTKRSICEKLGISDSSLNALRKKNKINLKFKMDGCRVIYSVDEIDLENARNIIKHERREGRLQK